MCWLESCGCSPSLLKPGWRGGGGGGGSPGAGRAAGGWHSHSDAALRASCNAACRRQSVMCMAGQMSNPVSGIALRKCASHHSGRGGEPGKTKQISNPVTGITALRKHQTVMCWLVAAAAAPPSGGGEGVGPGGVRGGLGGAGGEGPRVLGGEGRKGSSFFYHPTRLSRSADKAYNKDNKTSNQQ